MNDDDDDDDNDDDDDHDDDHDDDEANIKYGSRQVLTHRDHMMGQSG